MNTQDKFNFAMCGCGNMANWHAEELLKLNKVNIVAVVDPSPPNAEAFKKKHAPEAITYESLQTLVDKPPCKIDALVIVNTNAYGSKLEIFGKDYAQMETKVDTQTSQTPHANFVAAMEGREPLRAPARYGVLLSALMDAMYESGQTGKVVKVSPVPTSVE